MSRVLLVTGAALLLFAVPPATHAALVSNSNPNTLSLSQFIDASARDLFPTAAVDGLQIKFQELLLYLFERYPTAQSAAQHLPTMLREGKISSGAALQYWLEHTMIMAREHAYKHIEKSYWAKQQKIEYNMLGKNFAIIEEAVHGLSNLRFEPGHVAFFTSFVRDFMKKPASQTATVNDFVQEFKKYVKTSEAIHDLKTSNGTTNGGDVMAYRTFRSLGPFDMFFDFTSKITDAFYSVQKMMGPLRTIGAFIPGIGCTLNALNTVACFFNQNTGIAALLAGRVNLIDIAKCGFHMFGSIARGMDGIKLAGTMLQEFFTGLSGGGIQVGISNAMSAVSQSNINADPWVDLGLGGMIPGHNAIANSASVLDAASTLTQTVMTHVDTVVTETQDHASSVVNSAKSVIGDIGGTSGGIAL